MAFMAGLLAFAFVACDGNPDTTRTTTSGNPFTENPDTTQTTTSGNPLTENPDTTQTTTSGNPFAESSFIRRITPEEGVVEMIEASSGRIAYIDDELYIYYEEGLGPTSFFVRTGGETLEYDTHAPMGFSDFFFTNYDMDHRVLYYSSSIMNVFIQTVPSVIDAEIRIYPSSTRSVKHATSGWLLVSNEFLTIRGERLFADGGTVVFPYRNFGEDLRFYTYRSDLTQDQACTIRSYEGFESTAVDTLVHAEYTCDSQYRIVDRNVVIELVDFIHTGGFVTITPDGNFHVMDFSEAFPDFDAFDDDSIRYYDQVIYFRYEDTAGENHQVVANYDLSFMTIDLFNIDMASRNVFVDGDLRFYEYSMTEYRLYKDELLFYTYAPLAAYSPYPFFERVGDFGLVIETDFGTGAGRLVRIDLEDGTTVVHEFASFSGGPLIGGSLMMTDDGECFRYDVAADSFVDLGVSGAYRRVGENGFFVSTEEKLWLFDGTGDDPVAFDIVGFF